MSQQRNIFERVTRETLVLHDGNNGDWWFMDEKGVFVKGYFSSPIHAYQWAAKQGFTLTCKQPTHGGGELGPVGLMHPDDGCWDAQLITR